MSENQAQKQTAAVEDLYAEAEHWHVNTGGETIHAEGTVKDHASRLLKNQGKDSRYELGELARQLIKHGRL